MSAAAERSVKSALGLYKPTWTPTGDPSQVASSPEREGEYVPNLNQPEIAFAAHQWDPAFTGGPHDQARWLTLGLRALIDGGAEAVFVSFRDNHEFGRDSPFGSEGVLRWPRVRPKPAYAAVRRLARLTR